MSSTSDDTDEASNVGSQINTTKRTAARTRESRSRTNDIVPPRVTRSGVNIIKLIDTIDKIMNEQEAVDMNALQCIICCNAKKSIILLPCRHQHTCEPCWTLWKMQSMDNLREMSFDDDDDNILKPKCPYCNTFVDSNLKAIN